MNQEIHLKVMRQIEANPEITQRELAQNLGVSLGKANYCLRGLIEKGLVKARNFKNSNDKRSYLYHLTPAGIAAKTRITQRYLQWKMKEYELLRQEIEELKQEVQGNGNGDTV